MEIEVWENESGRSPVRDFIMTESPKAQRRIQWVLDLFEEKGLSFILFTGHVNKLQGYKMYEIVVSYGGVFYRIFFVIAKGIAWLLHAFKKKTNATPLKEIKIALKRAKQLQYENSS